MAPLEPWEKVLVDIEAYSEDVHSNFSCSECHAGQQSGDKETAHTDLISYPSEDPELCGRCHTDVKATFPDSLHASQRGYWTATALPSMGCSRASHYARIRQRT